MDSGRILGALSLTVGTALYSVAIAVIVTMVEGAETDIAAVSPALEQIVNIPVLVTLLGAVALALGALTIYSWLSVALRGMRSSVR